MCAWRKAPEVVPGVFLLSVTSQGVMKDPFIFGEKWETWI